MNRHSCEEGSSFTLPLAETRWILPGNPSESRIVSSLRGVCPICGELCDGVRILRDARLFARKFCTTHGRSEALISSDADWSVKAATFVKPGTIPLQLSSETRR